MISIARILKTGLLTSYLFVVTACTKNIHITNSAGSICSFTFPKEAKITKVAQDDPSRDWLISFQENKKIFISTNDVSGSPLNRYKQEEYGENIVVKMVANDSLILYGRNSSGNWKEIKQDGIVYGYMNIPDNEVLKFEKLIIPICNH